MKSITTTSLTLLKDTIWSGELNAFIQFFHMSNREHPYISVFSNTDSEQAIIGNGVIGIASMAAVFLSTITYPFNINNNL